jgi:hypothetical protein
MLICDNTETIYILTHFGLTENRPFRWLAGFIARSVIQQNQFVKNLFYYAANVNAM